MYHTECEMVQMKSFAGRILKVLYWEGWLYPGFPGRILVTGGHGKLAWGNGDAFAPTDYWSYVLQPFELRYKA